jgi:hypothetical protein
MTPGCHADAYNCIFIYGNCLLNHTARVKYESAGQAMRDHVSEGEA